MGSRIMALTWPSAMAAHCCRRDRSVHVPDHGDPCSLGTLFNKFAARRRLESALAARGDCGGTPRSAVTRRSSRSLHGLFEPMSSLHAVGETYCHIGKPGVLGVDGPLPCGFGPLHVPLVPQQDSEVDCGRRDQNGVPGVDGPLIGKGPVTWRARRDSNPQPSDP
jgi:hypothetical protein